MSLFVAVRPTDTAAEDLADVVQRARRHPDAAGLRWQPPGLWHVTLAFLGDADDDVADEVAERLDDLTARQAVDGVRLAGAGHFGRQVLWVGLAEGPAVVALSALATTIPGLLRGSGAGVDRRPWQPHLTLARARGADVRASVPLLAGYGGPAWTVDELLLIRSTGGPHPEHHVLRTYRLAPPRRLEMS